MWKGFPLFPRQASVVAQQVDTLYYFLVGISLFFSLLIFILVLYFAIRYRRRSKRDRPPLIHGSLRLELVWTIIPFIIAMALFTWGASLYFSTSFPPEGAMDIYVVGKQWMWKLQHPEGNREINELHVPIGQPVQLLITSEDVIHSFYVPAFRMKMDAVPGRYTTTWFQATKTGEYHLFCAEYCGTDHSRMVGRIVVMEPEAYERWLSGGAAGESMATAGERLFQQLGCATCHRADGTGRGPSLVGVWGKPVLLTSGQRVVVDESYERRSILNPNAQIVAGYRPNVMPSFQGQISEEGLLQIIAYVKSLAQEGRNGQ